MIDPPALCDWRESRCSEPNLAYDNAFAPEWFRAIADGAGGLMP